MTSQISTPVGIPNELNFSLPSSMIPSRKTELRVPVPGNSVFTTAGQVARISLPKMSNTLYNTQTGYLFGTVSFTTPGTAGTDFSYLLGSWYSLFSRQVIRAGSGYVLETIDNPGKLVNAISSMTMNASEKVALNNSFGFNDLAGYTNLGVKIFADTDAAGIGGASGDEKNFTFAFPLIGILNNTKFWPAWISDSIDIELTLDNFSNYLLAATANAVTGVSISNLEYVCECLELSPESYSMIIAQNPSQVVLKTQSYSYGSTSLPASQGAGTIDIPFQIKVNSLKQLFWYSQPSDAMEKTFAGVNPNLDNWSFYVNTTSYPQRPVQSKYPSESFMQNQKSFGSIYSSSHSGSATRGEFNTASTAYNNYHRPYNTAVANATQRANKWYQCLDLESINSNKESLYSGIATTGLASTIRLNIASTLAAQVHNIHYWSCHDVLVVMDMATGIVSVSV